MNIYDETKVITHEEAKNKVKSNHNKFYTEGEFTKDMLDYITQQEKKDKLLELYQTRDGLGLTESDLYAELTQKITKLEKEMNL